MLTEHYADDQKWTKADLPECRETLIQQWCHDTVVTAQRRLEQNKQVQPEINMAPRTGLEPVTQ